MVINKFLIVISKLFALNIKKFWLDIEVLQYLATFFALLSYMYELHFCEMLWWGVAVPLSSLSVKS